MADRQGYTKWDRMIEAGAIQNYIAWDDREVIRDHAIGKTKDVMGNSFPIDLAVAYSLISSGPNAPLTLKELVNENTRMATIMMTGKVGYGEYQPPDLESCNHDMKDTKIYYFPKVQVNEVGGRTVLRLISGSSALDDNSHNSAATDLDMPAHIRDKCIIYSDNLVITGNPLLSDVISLGNFNDVRLWLQRNHKRRMWIRCYRRRVKFTFISTL